jgi:hypothetical protein
VYEISQHSVHQNEDRYVVHEMEILQAQKVNSRASETSEKLYVVRLGDVCAVIFERILIGRNLVLSRQIIDRYGVSEDS